MRDDSGIDVGFDESWSWRCLLRGERTVSQWWNTWMSVEVNSLMEWSLQNPGTSSVHIFMNRTHVFQLSSSSGSILC